MSSIGVFLLYLRSSAANLGFLPLALI